MDRISAPSVQYPSGTNSLRQSDHLAPVTNYQDGRSWSLQVVQQPIRARMCGFGDKVGEFFRCHCFATSFNTSQDRRPITPPPCIRLIVRDAQTDKEIDIKYVHPGRFMLSRPSNHLFLSSEIDTSFYVLTVDLWNADGTSEVNLVKHSATSPSISTAMSSSYPPPPQSVSPTYPGYNQNQYPVGYPPQMNNYYGGQQVAYQNQYGQPVTYPQYYSGGQMPQSMSPATQAVAGGPGGMFTRNLIGSLSASAFRLTDPDNKIGVWFILQDLSVRTEGTFR